MGWVGFGGPGSSLLPRTWLVTGLKLVTGLEVGMMVRAFETEEGKERYLFITIIILIIVITGTRY